MWAKAKQRKTYQPKAKLYLSENVHGVLHHDPELHIGSADDFLGDRVQHVDLTGNSVVQLGDLLLEQLFLLGAEQKVCRKRSGLLW